MDLPRSARKVVAAAPDSGPHAREEAICVPMIDRDGVRIHVDDLGHGPPVVWHTGGGGDGQMWIDAGYLEALPRFRHVVIDHRGHGRSDCPTSPAAHDLDCYVADVTAVLDELDVGPAVFVGYSAGATVGFASAAAVPERWSGLVALGSAPDGVDDVVAARQLAADVRVSGMAQLMQEFASEEDEPPPDWFLHNLSATDPEMFALLLERWALTPERPWVDLPSVTVPALVITGTQECPDEASDATLGRLPQGRAVRLPGFGHLQVFWRSDVVAPLVADFVRSVHGSLPR